MKKLYKNITQADLSKALQIVSIAAVTLYSVGYFIRSCK